MIITLSPYAPLPGSDEHLSLVRAGDTLTVNGQLFDFTPLPNGGELPSEAIESEWFVGSVMRRAGRLELALRFPLAENASSAARFPEPMLIEADGPVELPR
ncbi:hypothetical protein AO896_19050 [Pseudomonas aeruginosa]|uniref:Uncharacterized protein n=1 Tax=Pseudomonas paraeruginosa (strain DSM 24068 / PA7) TaxID=381754 RepID=A0A4D6FS09_PSEP7|nr:MULTISPECIES: hypothetical protein [Pseudomonas aeruginosa group]KSC87540.1 hypothetical protein AO896_19050 [Pseudomonas aeruginosa]KSD18209.1 hypothetical protein AO898_17005 [Pseudomonas aeruginosa]KSG50944.1 hypothetical protein AO955_10235 [Pseudomonas aeruginosa]MCW8358419.1 hypothetical protein [Pseudomonas aeruginosa]MCW8367890.1 hypothetical protein [Pseudomonas aeruginosa]